MPRKKTQIRHGIRTTKKILKLLPGTLAEISDGIGWSKQRTSYWLKKIEKSQLIQHPRGAYFPYTLTEKGEVFKKSLAEDEGGRGVSSEGVGLSGVVGGLVSGPLVDVHNHQVLVPIVEFGDLPRVGVIRMTNWGYYAVEGFEGVDVRVNLGRVPKLSICVPSCGGSSIREVEFRNGMRVVSICGVLQRKFHCVFDVDHVEFGKKPHIHVFHDPVLRELAKSIKFVGQNIHVDESGGAFGELTSVAAAFKYDRLLDDVPRAVERQEGRLDRVEGVLCEVAGSLEAFAVGMREHMALIRGLQEAAAANREVADALVSVVEALRK